MFEGEEGGVDEDEPANHAQDNQTITKRRLIRLNESLTGLMPVVVLAKISTTKTEPSAVTAGIMGGAGETEICFELPCTVCEQGRLNCA